MARLILLFIQMEHCYIQMRQDLVNKQVKKAKSLIKLIQILNLR